MRLCGTATATLLSRHGRQRPTRDDPREGLTYGSRPGEPPWQRGLFRSDSAVDYHDGEDID